MLFEIKHFDVVEVHSDSEEFVFTITINKNENKNFDLTVTRSLEAPDEIWDSMTVTDYSNYEIDSEEVDVRIYFTDKQYNDLQSLITERLLKVDYLF